MAQEMTTQPLLNDQYTPNNQEMVYAAQTQPYQQQQISNAPYQQMQPTEVVYKSEIHPTQSFCAMVFCICGCFFCPAWIIPMCCCRKSQDSNARFWANCSCYWFLAVAIIYGLAIGIVLLLIYLGVIIISDDDVNNY